MKARRRNKRRQSARAYIGEKRVIPQETSLPLNAPGLGRTYCVMAMPVPEATLTAVPTTSVPSRKKSRSGAIGRGLRLMAGLLIAVVAMTSPIWLTTEPLLPVMKQLGAASASMQLPAKDGQEGVIEGEVIVPNETTASQQTTTSSTAATSSTSTTTNTTQNTDGLLPVEEKQLGNSGTRVGDIYVKNSTNYSPDFEDLISEKADCKIKLNAGYQVLIMHTHTTECYAQREDGLYSPDYSPRTTDHSKSVVAVGDVLAEQLEAVGIRTLHITEMHDHPQYNGSYDRALDTIEKYLKENPSIEMVLDVHRDAITYDSGAKLKPTAIINDRKAAQVMIISGCDAGGKLYFPEWESNLTMALQIQQTAQNSHSGLMRPLSFAPYRYNMHMTPNSLLLEFGTDANTLEEALYSAELLGKSIAEVLLRYVV